MQFYISNNNNNNNNNSNNIKVNFTLEQAMNALTWIRSRGLQLYTFFSLGTRWGG
jgi:hypothetical protein